jgi:hypothetical protein
MLHSLEGLLLLSSGDWRRAVRTVAGETIKNLASPARLSILPQIFVIALACAPGAASAAEIGTIEARADLIKDLADQSNPAKITRIAPENFFASLVRDLSQATSSVVVTAILRQPPSIVGYFDKDNAAKWYANLPLWADAQGRRLERLIGAGSLEPEGGDKMYNWFVKECGTIKNPATYALRVFAWDGKTDLPNVIVFDNKRAYLILSAPSGQLNDASILLIENEVFARTLVQGYFDILFQSGLSCPSNASRPE